MYIRTTTNGRGVAYYHLVESYRDHGKVKQRTLLSLGKVEDGKLEQLAEAISDYSAANWYNESRALWPE